MTQKPDLAQGLRPEQYASRAGGSAPAPQDNGGGRFPRLLLLALLGVAVVLAFGIINGIRGHRESQAELVRQAQNAGTLPVEVIHPTPGAAASEILLPGSTEAFTDAPIFARVSGYLKKWHVDIGARVTEDQLLAEIETPEVDQQLQQAKAELKNAQANLEIAQITSDRDHKLLADRAVSLQQAQQAASDLASRQAQLSSQEANVRRLEQIKDFQSIEAPFDGIITARNTDIGDLVRSGDNGNNARPLFRLADVHKLRVYIAVPEVNAASVQDGEKVTLTLGAFPGETFHGMVVRNANAIDPVTRTLRVEVDVDNSGGRLMPGSYAFVHLPVAGNTKSVTLPANALLFRSEGLRVGVVRDGHVKLVPITIGHDYGTSVEVVEGLTPEDAVILNPSDSLADGTPVEVRPSEPPQPTK